MKQFKINLKPIHDASGLSCYEVAKRLRESFGVSISKTTVGKYADGEVTQKQLPDVVVILCEFYGVNWRDPSVIQIVDVDETPEIKSLLDARVVA